MSKINNKQKEGQNMKKTATLTGLITLLGIVAVILTGCENPVGGETPPPLPDTTRFLNENNRAVEASAPVITQPEYVEGGLNLPVGSKVTVRIAGGQYPFTFSVNPNKGYVQYAPENTEDFRTFIYTAEVKGSCSITVIDRQKRADTMTINNI